MQRAGLILLVAALLLLAATLQAQTSGMQFGGIPGSAGISRGGAARAGRGGEIVGRRGGRERRHRHGEGNAGFFYPFWYNDYYDNYGEPPEAYAPPEPQVPPSPAMMPPQPERIPSPPKMTEIPKGRMKAARPLPPALFILTNGERLESRQYLLTADRVQLTVDRRQQSIPLDQLDLKATLAANRKRGIDLHIPASGGVISLGF